VSKFTAQQKRPVAVQILINNHSFDTRLIFATGTGTAVACQKKTSPPTELQIPATVTMPITVVFCGVMLYTRHHHHHQFIRQ